MAEKPKTMGERMAKVEQSLEDHIAICERDGRETKWWVRFIGSGVLVFVGKLAWTYITTGHA